jgi:hypothetical protein
MMATRRFSTLFLALGAAGMLATAACGDELPTGLALLGNVQPDDSCVVKATSGGGQQVFLSRGILDVSVGTQYYMYLMVRNSVPSLGAATGFEAEDARLDGGAVRIESVQVQLELSSAILTGPELVDRLTQLGVTLDDPTRLSYSRPGATFVDPGGTGVLIVDVIPGNIGRALRAIPELTLPDTAVQVVAHVKAVGHRLDGVKVKSAELSYPITICNNCRVAHVYDTAIARDPFNPNNPDGALDPSLLSDACVPGADDAVTNAFCGALWGPASAGGGDPCKLDRCLGTAGATTLVCPNDGASFEADFIPATAAP